MADTFAPGRTAEWLATSVEAAAESLASQWLNALVDLPAISAPALFDRGESLAHLGGLICDIAGHLKRQEGHEIASNRAAMNRAAELGELRFAQRASIHQLLRDYQMLLELLEEFVAARVGEAEPPLPADEVLSIMRHVAHAILRLQQQTIDTFIARYAATIERQNRQLLAIGRTVAHEIRQPLSVLQVISHVLPARTGDLEAVHVIDIMERNVARLSEVAARLERAALYELETDVSPNQRTLSLTALVDDVAARLADAARARGVRVSVDAGLPVVEVDQSRMELVFLNLIANAIKHSDPAKDSRFVRIEAVRGMPSPTVVVRDNGVGIPAARVQHLFRELGRAHGYRAPDLGGQGLGLGLSIVRECMDAIGGSVRVESTEHIGTAVTLTWKGRPSGRP